MTEEIKSHIHCGMCLFPIEVTFTDEYMIPPHTCSRCGGAKVGTKWSAGLALAVKLEFPRDEKDAFEKRVKTAWRY